MSINLLFCIMVGLKPYHQRPRTRYAEINSKLVNVTLSTSGWSGTEPPYKYTIEDSGISSDVSIAEIAPVPNASVSEILSYLRGNFCGGNISTGSIEIHAYGEKPIDDIPIVLVLRGGIS